MIRILILLALLISIPVAVYLVGQQTNLFPKASENGSVKLINAVGEAFPNNTTSSRFIYFEIERPDWPTNRSQLLIKPALAQTNDQDVSTPVLNHDLQQPRPGQSFTVFWRNIPNPTSKDWIGLYKVGSADTDFINAVIDGINHPQWLYTSSCNQQAADQALSAGSCPASLAATLDPGEYDLRFFANDSFSRIAISPSFTVIASIPTPTHTPTPILIPTPTQTPTPANSAPIPQDQLPPIPSPVSIPTASPEIEITARIRLSLDQNSVQPTGVCDDSDPKSTNYCREIIASDNNLLKRVSWTLPDQSGQYTLHAGFISNKEGFRQTSTSFTYQKNAQEFPIPDIVAAVTVQTSVNTLISSFGRIPTPPVIGALFELATRAHEIGEEVITISQARQLGLDITLASDLDGTVIIIPNYKQLESLGLDVEFYPEPDPVTGEERIVILPKPIPYYSPNGEFFTNLNETASVLTGDLFGRVAGFVGQTAARPVGAWLSSAVKRFPPPRLLGRTITYDLSNEISREAIDEMAQKLQAMPRGKGKFGWVFINELDKIVYKIFRPVESFERGVRSEIQRINQFQIDFYKRFGGQAGIAQFLGEVVDPRTGRVIGFKQEYIHHETLEQFANSGKRLTPQEVQQSIADLRQIYQTTGYAHGDLYYSIRDTGGAAEYIHSKNIVVQTARDAAGRVYRRVRFLDFAGNRIDILRTEYINEEFAGFSRLIWQFAR